MRTLDGVERGDVRALHRMRVATRRLRELLPVLQLDGRTAEKLGDRLRRAARRIGSVRELDVMLETLEAMRREIHDGASAIDVVARRIRDAREAARGKHLSGATVRELRALARKLDRLAWDIENDPIDRERARAWRWAADARAARRAAALNDAVADAGAIYLPERIHSVRIALKKFRYAVELVAAAHGDDRRGDLAALKRAQNLLGRLHDLQVLLESVRRIQTGETPSVRTWRELDLLIAALEDRCRRLHARYVRQRGSLLAVVDRYAAKSARPRASRRAG
jgi:CHAD domain-containing protein